MWSEATRVTRKLESSQRSGNVELRNGKGLALRHLEGPEGFRDAVEYHRHLCPAAFKSFKLANSRVTLANARPQAARICERAVVEYVARAA
jgi:hypothetical protein